MKKIYRVSIGVSICFLALSVNYNGYAQGNYGQQQPVYDQQQQPVYNQQQQPVYNQQQPVYNQQQQPVYNQQQPGYYQNSQQGMNANFQQFYDNLSPYGRWINSPQWGYVWSPNVPVGFMPYSTNGHWVYTDQGWTWVSDYDWGWAAFHYGRWELDNMYGWLWIPGNEWAPAWVVWRSGGGMYGWAPLGAGVGINISINTYIPAANRWCFVPQQYINDPGLSRYYINVKKNQRYLTNTVYINNTVVIKNTREVYASGPGRGDVEKIINTSLNPVVIQSSARPGRTVYDTRQVTIYRPAIQHVNNERVIPQKPVDYRSGQPMQNVPQQSRHYYNTRTDAGTQSVPNNGNTSRNAVGQYPSNYPSNEHQGYNNMPQQDELQRRSRRRDRD